MTESVGSLPTKTSTFSGDASGDVPMCTCRTQFELFVLLLHCCRNLGELLLFIGCIVNFCVSVLICMFQDSVPAGSYNDPFLSSVCVPHLS